MEVVGVTVAEHVGAAASLSGFCFESPEAHGLVFHLSSGGTPLVLTQCPPASAPVQQAGSLSIFGTISTYLPHHIFLVLTEG
jgi:hypothetical protein